MSAAARLQAEANDEVRRHWPAILACFATAVLAWGFGFSGTSVYLADLHQLRGWSTALIAMAITTYYLAGALCLAQVHRVLHWLGPARLLGCGATLLCVGAVLFSRSTQVWQMFVAALVMACGWAGCTSTAISTALALYFHRQRGLAITLALNGASAAGFTVAPVLVTMGQRYGVGLAVPLTAAALLAVVLPLIGFGFAWHPAAAIQAGRAANASAAAPRSSELLRTWRFWSVSLPFALALAAQVGMIVHLVTFLLPQLGATAAAGAVSLTSLSAMGGRLALAGIMDRLHQRRVAAASFASQAVGLGLLATAGHQPELLYAGCLLFGLSVGNVITFPALIVQREFPAAAFGVVIGLSTGVGQFTYALAPMALGLLRDVSGSYIPVLAACMALQLAAAVVVLAGAPPGR